MHQKLNLDKQSPPLNPSYGILGGCRSPSIGGGGSCRDSEMGDLLDRIGLQLDTINDYYL